PPRTRWKSSASSGACPGWPTQPRRWPDGPAHRHIDPALPQRRHPGGRRALRLTGDSWIACHIYTDNPPILSFEDEHVSVSISPADPNHVAADDVAQAHRLADALAAYIAELDKHVTAPAKSEGVAA